MIDLFRNINLSYMVIHGHQFIFHIGSNPYEKMKPIIEKYSNNDCDIYSLSAYNSLKIYLLNFLDTLGGDRQYWIW